MHVAVNTVSAVVLMDNVSATPFLSEASWGTAVLVFSAL